MGEARTGGIKHEAVNVRVSIAPHEVGKLQESDLMDRMPDGAGAEKVDSGTEHVRLVSLGQSCAPKLAFKHLGRGAETLPFDWIRTRLDGVLNFMRNDFDGFYDFIHSSPVPGIDRMTMYRNKLHSFWHDNPTDSNMRERYGRRIERFKAIDATSGPVLFVRAAAEKAEVQRLPELMEELINRFGPQAHLLCILSHQEHVKGAAVVEGFPNLLVHFLERGAHSGPDNAAMVAYAEPVRNALDWTVGRELRVLDFPDLKKVAEAATEISNGFEGLGGLFAFEPDSGEAADLLKVPPRLFIVSLGHHFGPSDALKRLRRQAAGGAYPFDSASTRFDGLLRFVRDDFKGFLDDGGLKQVTWAYEEADVGVPSAKDHHAHCGPQHAFWYEDPHNEDTIAEYNSRFDRFRALGDTALGGGQLLFVRVAAEAEVELSRAPELLDALTQRFGERAHLLLVLDYQQTAQGPATVEGHSRLLLHFLQRDEESYSSSAGVAAAYSSPIEFGINWLSGKPFAAIPFPSIQNALDVLDEDNNGLCGLGGLPTYLDAIPPNEAVGSVQ